MHNTTVYNIESAGISWTIPIGENVSLLPGLQLYSICRDMIELFKITKGMYDPTCVPHVDFMKLSRDLIRTRSNNFKLIQYRCHYDLRTFNFTNRVIPIWNSLSNHVVSADTINTFKDPLDKFWSNQDVLYDYKSDLHGIGNSSIII